MVGKSEAWAAKELSVINCFHLDHMQRCKTMNLKCQIIAFSLVNLLIRHSLIGIDETKRRGEEGAGRPLPAETIHLGN